MSKAIIIYRSKTGFSQRYAGWLSEELGCRAVPFSERGRLQLTDYDPVILAGGLYAGQMAGLKWLARQLPHLAGRRVAALAVGCAPMDNPGLPESMDKLFGPLPQVRGFYCQGGLDYERMGAVDRAMMAALRAFLKGKKGSEEMLAGISQSFDGAKRENLAEILAWVRGE